MHQIFAIFRYGCFTT